MSLLDCLGLYPLMRKLPIAPLFSRNNLRPLRPMLMFLPMIPKFKPMLLKFKPKSPKIKIKSSLLLLLLLAVQGDLAESLQFLHAEKSVHVATLLFLSFRLPFALLSFLLPFALLLSLQLPPRFPPTLLSSLKTGL